MNEIQRQITRQRMALGRGTELEPDNTGWYLFGIVCWLANVPLWLIVAKLLLP